MALELTDDQDQRLTPNGRLLAKILEAKKCGDYDLAQELRKDLIIPAETLMATKICMGADWIRERGLRTETAEEKYGKDWLDR